MFWINESTNKGSAPLVIIWEGGSDFCKGYTLASDFADTFYYRSSYSVFHYSALQAQVTCYSANWRKAWSPVTSKWVSPYMARSGIIPCYDFEKLWPVLGSFPPDFVLFMFFLDQVFCLVFCSFGFPFLDLFFLFFFLFFFFLSF